ncbi:MAG: DUF4124 domain-containing protein [Betaproteobacteria bacterium]|nr:DUF4124 domain-containing protein [Betaproteobacteria bacterium]
MLTTTKQIAISFFLMLLFSAGVAAAPAAQSSGSSKMYKWVDDQGVVHYSDKAPMDAGNHEQTVLDKQARSVKKIEAVNPTQKPRKLSDEEVAQQQREQEEKNNAERQDKALMTSYLSEGDIDLARDRDLSALDAQIEATKVVLTQQQTRRKELLTRKEKGGVLPQGELETLEGEIATRNGSIDRALHEKENLTAKYEQRKIRWRELKAAERARLDAEQTAQKK